MPMILINVKKKNPIYCAPLCVNRQKLDIQQKRSYQGLNMDSKICLHKAIFSPCLPGSIETNNN